MTTSFDRSHKDKQYFIDGSTYNCPFCKRRNVKYKVAGTGSYDSSNTKTVYYYLINCSECRKTSFHLSKHELVTTQRGSPHYDRIFNYPLEEYTTEYSANSTKPVKIESALLDEKNNPNELDDAFFYNQPTSFFTIDERIPKSTREPLNEAENALKSNYLTGASAGLRKAIYKLLKHESISETDTQGGFTPHDKRVDQLKSKYPKIESELFDELKAVHMLTSQELHENDWEDFDAYTLQFLIGVTNEILIEMYVTPDETKKRREEIAALKNKAKPKKTQKDD